MTRLSYALRKHPAMRLAAIVIGVLAGVLLLLLLTRQVTKKPNVEAIVPSVGAPGEILTVRGDFFGNERASSYVEFCGNRITESGYVLWKNVSSSCSMSSSVFLAGKPHFAFSSQS